MRRLDADGDDELSFSDFFQGLLPYFIYGDLKTEKTADQKRRSEKKQRVKSENRHITIQVNNRAKSAKARQPLTTKSVDDNGYRALRSSPREHSSGKPKIQTQLYS